MHTFVIVEAGGAHDRSKWKAKRLIDAAKHADADAVKFQFFSSAYELAVRRGAVADYQEIYERYQLPYQWIDELKTYCDERDIEFMATTYLPQDVATINPYVKRFKVSSFEALDIDFLRAHKPFEKPIYVSVGMATIDQVNNALRHLEHWVNGNALLHCVSAYPAPLSALNLNVCASMVEDFLFGWDTGFSDHSGCLEAGGVAVAVGASIIEVHAKLEDTDPQNPDAGPFALTPSDLLKYVGFIRQVETMLGDGNKRVQACEEPMLRYRVVA